VSQAQERARSIQKAIEFLTVSLEGDADRVLTLAHEGERDLLYGLLDVTLNLMEWVESGAGIPARKQLEFMGRAAAEIESGVVEADQRAWPWRGTQ
jgi:hypothetical protein